MTATLEPIQTTQNGAIRGERLYPPRSSRLYWTLTCLRRQFEAIIDSEVRDRDHERLVDFGCGNMPYRPLFEGHVKEYLGCDLPGNEMADHIMDTPNCLPFESESLDIVLSSQVLEHVFDPSAYLNEAYRVLRPGGILILSTHGVWRYHPDPHDFWRWTCDGLRQQIALSRFEISQFKGILGPESTALQLLQDSVLQRIPKFVRTFYVRLMQSRIRRADIRCSNSIRDSEASVYIVVAKKKISA